MKVSPMIALRAVALRKESVDRNLEKAPQAVPMSVALRKESVDRNMKLSQAALAEASRSPQGERG